MNLSRSAAKKGLDGKKYSVVIYEQIRFCEIKSNLNPRFAEKARDYAGTAEYNAER